MHSGLVPSHAQGMGTRVRRWSERNLWPQICSLSYGDKDSDTACLPGCGLYLGEELSSTLLRITWLPIVEHLLPSQASTRHCEVGAGHIFQRKKLRLDAASLHKVIGLEIPCEEPHTMPLGFM